MKVKFNLFERVAGLFVLSALVSALGLTIGMGVKKGWFETRVPLVTYVKAAEGIHSGTVVQFAGLRVGSVDSVDLKKGQQVEIKFSVIKKFSSRFNVDSRVKLLRPFIIGEKVLEIIPGEGSGDVIEPGQILVAEHAPDLLDLLSGNELGSYIQSLNSTMANLQKLAEAFLSNERSDKMIELFDQMVPLMTTMNGAASEIATLTGTLNNKDSVGKAMNGFLNISKQMNKMLPVMASDVPKLSKNILLLTNNLNSLTSEMQQVLPIVKKMAPEFPAASRKAISALDETVITLKAMQKTFFLRSSVREVKEEEKRKPAGQD